MYTEEGYGNGSSSYDVGNLDFMLPAAVVTFLKSFYENFRLSNTAGTYTPFLIF